MDMREEVVYEKHKSEPSIHYNRHARASFYDITYDIFPQAEYIRSEVTFILKELSLTLQHLHLNLDSLDLTAFIDECILKPLSKITLLIDQMGEVNSRIESRMKEILTFGMNKRSEVLSKRFDNKTIDLLVCVGRKVARTVKMLSGDADIRQELTAQCELSFLKSEIEELKRSGSFIVSSENVPTLKRVFKTLHIEVFLSVQEVEAAFKVRWTYDDLQKSKSLQHEQFAYEEMPYDELVSKLSTDKLISFARENRVNISERDEHLMRNRNVNGSLVLNSTAKDLVVHQGLSTSTSVQLLNLVRN